MLLTEKESRRATRSAETVYLKKEKQYKYKNDTLINKTPLWKEWMESYYIRKYMKYVTSFDMTKEVAIKNISMLFNIFYFMLSVTIIYLLIAHIIELLLALTERE